MVFASTTPMASRGYAWQGVLLLFILTVIGMLSINLFGRVVSFSLLPLIGVILWPRGASPRTSIIAMLVFGLLLDALTGGPLGLWALIYLAVFLVFRPHQRLKPLKFNAAFVQVLAGLLFALILAFGLAWFANSHRPQIGLMGPPLDGFNEGTLTRRMAILGAGGTGVFGILASRLYYLQVIKAEDYTALSEDNRFNFNITMPVRGRILDRYGESLAVNRPDFRVVLIPERIRDLEKTLDLVSEVLPLKKETRERIRKDVKENANFVPILIEDHLDWKTFSALNLKTPELPGVIPEVGEGRSYPNNGIFTHTLGYVGRAGPADVEKDKDPLLLQPTFRIGKTGVEAAVDKELRGKAGRLKVEVNAVGRIVREWPDPKDAAQDGKDVWLTIDAELQRYAAELYEDDSGGIAVIDVVTGELRTLLSMPSFDGNLFVSGLTQADMDALTPRPLKWQSCWRVWNPGLSTRMTKSSALKKSASATVIFIAGNRGGTGAWICATG